MDDLEKQFIQQKTDEFQKRLRELEQETGMRVVPAMHYLVNGILPAIKVVPAPKDDAPPPQSEPVKK